MKLAFTLEYEGTSFSCFQRQHNAESIQEHIETALEEITGTKITINYSGRTDAGVHALSQVFDFDTNIERSAENWIKALIQIYLKLFLLKMYLKCLRILIQDFLQLNEDTHM